MSMQNVAVFWDYENCPAPANASGYAIANSISTLARSFGSIKVFKAYLEISDQSRSSLRSELQSSGVSLVDCPHNGRKDVADKMILVDMLSYAIDNPAPSTIFLVTGDRDFAYALSSLKNRHYKAVLVKRPGTHVSLTFQACICFDWFDDVVHQAENSSPQAEHRNQRHQQCSDLICNAASLRPSPCHSVTEDTGSGAETVDIVDFLPGGVPDRIPPTKLEHSQVRTATDDPPRQNPGFPSSPKHRRGSSFSTSRDSTSKSTLAQEKQHTSLKAPILQFTQPPILLPLRTDNSPAIKEVPCVESYSIPASRSADMDNTRAHITKPTGTFPKLLQPTKDVLSPISSSPIKWPAPASPTIPNSTAAPPSVHEETKSITSPPAAPPVSPEELAEKFLQKEPMKNVIPISPLSAIGSPSPRPSTSTTTTVDTVTPRMEYSVAQNLTDAEPANLTSGITSDNGWITFQPASGPGQSTGPLELDTLVIPPNFVILVAALKRFRIRGEFQPLRSSIALIISNNGATYRKAGVTSFRQYSLLAEQAGIVDMGGDGGGAWIRLMPKWRGAHVVAPTTPSSTPPTVDFHRIP